MSNYLYHHGILGQKWGVRRFQRKDGSLTTAGMKRYGVEGHSYEEYKADRKHYKRHGLGTDFHLSEDGNKLYIDKLYNKRTGKEVDGRYADAIMDKRKVYMPETNSHVSKAPEKNNISDTIQKQQSPAERQKKAMTKGRAAVNGLLRQIGMSAAAGIGQFAASKIGGGVLSNYGTMAVKSLYLAGTAANVGYTGHKVVKSSWKKDFQQG